MAGGVTQMKNRLELAELFRDRGFKIGVEVGVYQGNYSLVLAQTIPDLTLYSVDPWVFHDRYKGSGETITNAHRLSKEKLEPLGVNIVQKFSMEAVKDFEPRSIDFVYIDGDHTFDSVMQDIIEWGRRVKKSGIISGHDYTDGTAVKEAVDMYYRHHKLELEVTEESDDHARSWMIVKKWGY